MTDLPEIYLQPGEWELVRTPTVLKTVLGSCVGITFRAPRLGIGSLCHPMLPHHAAHRHAHSQTAAIGRYVDSIIVELARTYDHLGVRRGEVEVKLFGGADVLATARKGATVGKLNADTAVRILEEEGFQIAASHLGGSCGVFIEFHTGSGDVFLRRLSHMDAVTLART
ncbi:MAG: chemotaxis protein CheD [Terracidiphilus sp.]